jgi:hypothetical protein
MRGVDRREAIAEEVVTKLYEKNVKDVRILRNIQLIHPDRKIE